MNHLIHIAAISQIRVHSEGRACTEGSEPRARSRWKPCGAP
jgi:hypothetical protein